MKRITIPCENFVSWVDPVDIEVRHYQWYTPIHELPEDINLRPNVRVQNTKSSVYKTIKKAQLNEDLDPRYHNSYHLGSGGITILTRRLDPNKKKNPTEVTMDNQGKINGIVNGGHQYMSALENKKKIAKMIEEDEPIIQYMPFHAIVGVKPTKINYIAKALNTNVQVTNAALLYSMGVFDDIETVLDSAGILEHFGKRGNEKTVGKLTYDISDNVVLLEAFNRHQYPDGTRHGTNCVSSKSTVIANYGRKSTRDAFSGMLHLLPSMWRLFETVRRTGWDMLNLDVPPDHVTWVCGPLLYSGNVRRPNAPGKIYKFPITKRSDSTQLVISATFCILSAFRQFLNLTSSSRYEWSRTFDSILKIWRAEGAEMMTLIDNKTRKMDREAASVLKTDTAGVWTDMYKILSKYN